MEDGKAHAEALAADGEDSVDGAAASPHSPQGGLQEILEKELRASKIPQVPESWVPFIPVTIKTLRVKFEEPQDHMS